MERSHWYLDVIPFDCLVALKQLKRQDKMEEFIHEASLLQQYPNPNIVQFYGVYVDRSNNHTYMVMEFMELGSLLDYLLSNETLSVLILQRMVLDCLQAMTFLESKNVIHRDLATRNLLVCSGGGKGQVNVKVSDLGMGKITAESANYYAKDSTMAVKWAAPEVINKQKFSNKR
jgi:serine/threonine protein kinase